MSRTSSKTANTKNVVTAFCAIIIFPAALCYLVLSFSVYHSPVFWVFSVIEIIFVVFIMRFRKKRINLLLVILGVLFPILSGLLKEIRREDIAIAICVFAVAAAVSQGIMGLKQELGGKKRSIPSNNSVGKNQRVLEPLPKNHFVLFLPTYLPDGYYENDRNEYKRSSRLETETIYTNNQNEHIIWLTQADGQISDIKPLRKSVFSEKQINGVLVSFAVIGAKRSRKRNIEEKPEFVEANWSNQNVNFNFKTDGLSIDEAEKVIASMIR
jgi:hypothetical protein